MGTPQSLRLPGGTVQYSKDSMYGYVPDTLVPTLNRLEKMTKQSIDVTCCKSGRTVQSAKCGEGTDCNGVCREETEHTIIQLSNQTQAESCSSSFSGLISSSDGKSRTKRTTCLCYLPLHQLGFCPYKV